jgi:hypothetical protein
MNQFFLSKPLVRLFAGAAAASLLVVAVLASGCGGSSEDSNGITVQTGSLSKAAFIEKADAICKAARTEFAAKYTAFVRTNQSALGNAQKEAALLRETVESLLAPNYEEQIEKIGALGAPTAYAPKVATFLKAVDDRLEEVRENPSEISATPFPFKHAEDVASAVGLKGCSESFG